MTKIFSQNFFYFFSLVLFSVLSIYSCSDEYTVEEDLCSNHTEVLSRENPCCSETQVILSPGPNNNPNIEGSCCGYRLTVISSEECPIFLFDDAGNILHTFTQESTYTSFTYCAEFRRSPTAFVIGPSFDDPCYTLDASPNPFQSFPFSPNYTCELRVVEVQAQIEPEDCCPVGVDVETSFSSGGDCCNVNVTISNPPCENCSYKLAIITNDGTGPDYQNFGSFVNGEARLSFQFCESDNYGYAITTDVGKVMCSNFTDQLNCN